VIKCTLILQEVPHTKFGRAKCPKFGTIWSTNQKVIDGHVDPPNWTFLGDYISALSGCWPFTFLHTLQPPKMYFKLDVGRRVASCWALPHISSYFLNLGI